MKKEEVPQDKSNLESANFKELCYAVDENGEYTTVNSSGWDPKTIALNKAIEDINERVEDAKQRVLNNQTSPVEYYMEFHKMDLQILASYVGLWKWRVKRHFKPKVFNKLSKKVLQKYADVFDVSIDQLKNIELHGN
jgi:tRNA/tmRNA/rRNA uracil-C5-methylase (TrmA/RlmC/RlmD family)